MKSGPSMPLPVRYSTIAWVVAAMVVIERLVECTASVTRGAECNLLLWDRYVWVEHVVVSDEPRCRSGRRGVRACQRGDD